ncbi:hypothetical protein DPMN_084631 [Dreissena polymorpha]|uniref:Uncharacterized protein n=1 Tax=Dreissena polymorpha TaxID=45954 RepID=A0A9D3YB51_DREPO|nr:hypothetical protein DPMN_084631 [Dreissena polymorpha]
MDTEDTHVNEQKKMLDGQFEGHPTSGLNGGLSFFGGGGEEEEYDEDDDDDDYDDDDDDDDDYYCYYYYYYYDSQDRHDDDDDKNIKITAALNDIIIRMRSTSDLITRIYTTYCGLFDNKPS